VTLNRTTELSGKKHTYYKRGATLRRGANALQERKFGRKTVEKVKVAKTPRKVGAGVPKVQALLRVETAEKNGVRNPLPANESGQGMGSESMDRVRGMG